MTAHRPERGDRLEPSAPIDPASAPIDPASPRPAAAALPGAAGASDSEGAPRADDLFDRAGDLEHTTQRLRQRGEQLLAEYERNAKTLATIGIAGSQVRGHGTAAEEAVIVELDGQHRLQDLQLDPRALRLGSIAKLREAIMDAFAAAAADVQDQLADRQPDLSATPVREMLESMPELMDLMPAELYQDYLEPSGPGRGDPTDALGESAAGEGPL